MAVIQQGNILVLSETGDSYVIRKPIKRLLVAAGGAGLRDAPSAEGVPPSNIAFPLVGDITFPSCNGYPAIEFEALSSNTRIVIEELGDVIQPKYLNVGDLLNSNFETIPATQPPNYAGSLPEK